MHQAFLTKSDRILTLRRRGEYGFTLMERRPLCPGDFARNPITCYLRYPSYLAYRNYQSRLDPRKLLRRQSRQLLRATSITGKIENVVQRLGMHPQTAGFRPKRYRRA